jgi:hypothetical protein
VIRTLRLRRVETLSVNNSGLKPAVIAATCGFFVSGESGKAGSFVDADCGLKPCWNKRKA